MTEKNNGLLNTNLQLKLQVIFRIDITAVGDFEEDIYDQSHLNQRLIQHFKVLSHWASNLF